MVIVRQLARIQARRIVLGLLLVPTMVVGILVFTSQAASARTNLSVTGSINCAFSGIVHFSPPLKLSGGGTNPSRVSGTLSGCTYTSAEIEAIGATPLRGEFSSSPFSCSSSSQTGATLSAVINWRGETANGRVAPTRVIAGNATGSFAGADFVLSLGLPSTLGTGCAQKRGLTSATVSGTLSEFTTATGAATCSYSGTVTFAPPLTASGGGTESSIEATLSSCKSNSGVVESFGSPQLDGTFTSSPFTCSSSSPTNATLSAVITWNGSAAWPSGEIAPTTLGGSSATGSFPGGAVVSLQVPSDIAAGCTGGPVSADSVTGTVTVGPECGVVGDPLSLYPMVPPVCGAQAYLPTSITSGPDGALWFLTYNSNLIGRTTTAGVTTFYPAPTGGQGTWGNGAITTGSDGALWFLAEGGSAIGRMTTSGSVTTYPLPFGWAEDITSGSDGNLWFAINNIDGSNAIGQLTTSGQLTTFTDPSLGTASWDGTTHNFLQDITSGPDGALWFSNWTTLVASDAQSGSIERISTSGVFSDYTAPEGVIPGPLAAGPDGAIWFGGGNASALIGRVTTSGQFSTYTDPGAIGEVLGIAAGPDGALWFTNYSVPGDTGFSPFPPIGRITTGGTITTYGNAYAEEGAMSIAAGPDGAMWFVDHINDSVGRISVP